MKITKHKVRAFTVILIALALGWWVLILLAVLSRALCLASESLDDLLESLGAHNVLNAVNGWVQHPIDAFNNITNQFKK